MIRRRYCFGRLSISETDGNFEGPFADGVHILNAMTGREWREHGVFHGTKASMRFSIYNYPLNIWNSVCEGRRRWMGDRRMEALIAALQGNLSPEKKAQLATGIDGRKAMEVVLGAYRSSEQGIMVRPEELH